MFVSHVVTYICLFIGFANPPHICLLILAFLYSPLFSILLFSANLFHPRSPKASSPAAELREPHYLRHLMSVCWFSCAAVHFCVSWVARYKVNSVGSTCHPKKKKTVISTNYVDNYSMRQTKSLMCMCVHVCGWLGVFATRGVSSISTILHF